MGENRGPDLQQPKNGYKKTKTKNVPGTHGCSPVEGSSLENVKIPVPKSSRTSADPSRYLFTIILEDTFEYFLRSSIYMPSSRRFHGPLKTSDLSLRTYLKQKGEVFLQESVEQGMFSGCTRLYTLDVPRYLV